MRDRLQSWDDEEIAPNGGLALKAEADVEVVVYVVDGAITHRDSLGNESRIEAGSIQVMSAGAGIRYSEYNAESEPARIFQILISPTSPGGSPAYAAQQCPVAPHAGGFVVVASGFAADHDALPIRARVRVLAARLTMGALTAHALDGPRRAYLVPSCGVVDVNGVRIHARDGASIEDIGIITITAIEDADVLMVDHSLRPLPSDHPC